MYQIETTKPVLVTGATGYVAGWIIHSLLQKGFTVHATVRNLQNTQKTKFLDQIASSSPGEIKYFQADLLKKGSFEQAMQGCSIVFHTASPLIFRTKNPQKELVEPAKQGTRNVLEQANKSSTVKRVVLTSSVAAMYSDNIDIKKSPNKVLTEDDWNTSSTINHQPYSFSKTVAEKEAWKIANNQGQWDLVVINPSFVMGPGINPHGTSESINYMRRLYKGDFRFGLPDVGVGVVDVRDVAQAHLAAAFNSTSHGRYIISGHNSSLLAMAKTLWPKYGNKFALPKKILPKFIAWSLGPIIDPALTRKYISRNVGHSWQADNSKSIKDLAIAYRPLEDTMNEFFQQIIATEAECF